MSAVHRKRALLSLAATVVIAGVLIAALTSGGHTHGANSTAARRGERASLAGPTQATVAAGYLGLSQVQMRRKLRGGLTLEQIADATPGKSAAGLLDALVKARAARLARAKGTHKLSAAARAADLARLRKRIQRQLERVPGYPGLAASARYLGLTTALLRSRLQSGRSLAQIADATPGKSAAGLIDTRVSRGESVLAAALASGRISKDTDSALRSTLRARITREVMRRPRT
jgi:hypothetical protein